MGKTKKHRVRYAAKPNPMGLGAALDDPAEFQELAVSADGPVANVAAQLQNPNVEEQLNGLQALAVFAASKDKVAAICESEVVRIAAPMLCESSQALRNAAAGAMRNLSTCGSELCDYLVEQDVMTPLLTLLNEYALDAQWKPNFDASMRDQLDLRSDVFLQAINLLWNLCESSSVALDTFNQSQQLPGLMRCLDVKLFGLDIAISLAQCLLVVSENNPKCWTYLNEHVATLHALLSLISSEHGHTYLRTLAAGILANVPALAAAYAAPILNALAKTLQENHMAAVTGLSAATAQVPASRVTEAQIKMDTTDEETEQAATLRRRRQELPTDAELAIRDVGYLLDAQRIAAEVITNICSSGDDEWLDEEGDADASDSDSIVEMNEDRGCNGSSTNLCDGDKLPVEIAEVIKSTALADSLWAKAQPLSVEVVHMLRQTSIALLMKVKNLRISSLLCLQNLCNMLEADDLGGATALYNVWVDLCQQVFKEPHDGTVLEPLTSLMRAVLERLKTHRELFGQMTKNDLELILNGIKNTGASTSVAELRANWLRMLGTLGCLLDEDFVKMIITYMIWSCEHEGDVWTISEALDALMDIFADNDWPQIVHSLQLPKVVRELQKTFKAKLRQQRKELRERYAAVRTVQENLARFVKHLETEALKCGNGTTMAQ